MSSLVPAVAAGCALSLPSRTPSPSRPSSPPSPLWGPRAARPCPTRLGRNRVDSQLDQACEASLSPPCTRALTASPRRRRITGGQRARLTPTLAFAPSTSPFRPHRLDAGRPRGGGLNRSYAPRGLR